MTTTPALLTIPDLAVDIILKNVDFKAMFSLRKVCRSLRTYIDKRKPEVQINTIECSITPDSQITVKLKCNPKDVNETKEIIYSESPFVSLHRDFRVIMSHWKSPSLIYFQVKLELENPDSFDINRKFIDCIRNTFLDLPNNQKLRVNLLHMEVTNEQEVMQLLPYVDTNTLNYIGLVRMGVLDLTDIRETEQWKGASTLYISSRLTDLDPMEAFIGRSRVTIAVVNRISSDQIMDLLMSFRDHDHIQEFSVSFLTFPDRQLFFEEFGEGTIEGTVIKWYASFVNKEVYVEVKISTEGIPRLSFKRIPDPENDDVLFFGDEDEGEADDDDEDEQHNNE